MHSAAVDADESWGAIGSLSVMVAALPAQEELYFAFTAARRRGRTAHVRPGLSPGVPLHRDSRTLSPKTPRSTWRPSERLNIVVQAGSRWCVTGEVMINVDDNIQTWIFANDVFVHKRVLVILARFLMYRPGKIMFINCVPLFENVYP